MTFTEKNQPSPKNFEERRFQPLAADVTEPSLSI